MALASGSLVTIAIDLMGETGFTVGAACLEAHEAIRLMNTKKTSFRTAVLIADHAFREISTLNAAVALDVQPDSLAVAVHECWFGECSCAALALRLSSLFSSLPASPRRQVPREKRDTRNSRRRRIRSKGNPPAGRSRAREPLLPTRTFCRSARRSASAAPGHTPANTRSSTVEEGSKGT